MNILQKLRKSSYSITFALLMLVYSCSQYDLNSERSFDYALYRAYKDNPVNDSTRKLVKSLSKKGKTTILNQQILNEINNQYKSDLSLPSNVFKLPSMSVEELKSFSLANGYVDTNDINLTENLIQDIQNEGINTGLQNYENDLNSFNLNDQQFEKYNAIANSLKVVNDENPSLLTKSNSSAKGGGLACTVSMIVWIAAIVGFVAGCTIVILCALAAFALLAATVDVIKDCVPNSPNNQS